MSVQIDQQQLRIIGEYKPRVRAGHSLMKAAVAMILRDGEQGTEVLLMQRAFHPKDPWSGQMAFPGGKIEPDDESAKAAAMREAYEEVGADLRERDYVGRLDDVYGLKVNTVFSVHIACFVFKPDRVLDLVANEEVADMVWLPLAYLNDRKNAHDFVHPSDPALAMPAVMINSSLSQVLWGLSLRMLNNFHSVLGADMGVLSEDDLAVLREIEQRELSPEAAKSVEQTIAQMEKSKAQAGK